MTVADGVILLILIVSGLFAFVRGLTQEVLSILAWVAAAAVAIYLYPFLGPWAQSVTGGGVAVGFAAAFVIFLLLAAPFYFFSHWLAERMRGAKPGNIDRTLGFVFGLARGLLLVAVGYLVLGLLDQDRPPDWMKKARLLPLVESTEGLLIFLLPEEMQEKLSENEQADAGDNGSAEAREIMGLEPGYTQQQRRALDQLVKTSEDGEEP